MLLILGVALWWAAHLLKRVAPGPRDKVRRGGVTALLLVSVLLMIFGVPDGGWPRLVGASAPLKRSTACWSLWRSICSRPMA